MCTVQKVLGGCWKFPRVDARLKEPAELLWLFLSELGGGCASLALRTPLTVST